MPVTSYASFPPLVPGDPVAVVAPASAPEAQRVSRGLDILRRWDLVPVVLPSVTARPALGHLAGSDTARARDLVTAWRDDTVRAIWCARGGYGAQRLLDLLPARLFAQGGPKPIIGFSDVTPLLHRALQGSGTQMVHGPAIVNLGEAGDETLDHLHTLLTEPFRPRTLLHGLRPWREGRPEGTLLGGNVALLAASIGTGDLPSAEGAIVLLEDVGQSAWVLDRGLTQLVRAGWLRRAAGIVLGDFSMDDDPAAVEAVLRDRLLPLGVPVWAGARIGHERVNLAVPLGGHARIIEGYLRLA